jgi:hypothetical protein
MLAASMNQGSRLPSQATLVGAGCAIVVALVAVIQVLHLGELMDPNQIFTAGHADRLVIGYALAALTLVAAAAFLPERQLSLPVAGGLSRFPYLERMVETFGGPVWSSSAGTLHELPDAPDGAR